MQKLDYVREKYSKEQIELVLNPFVKEWFFSKFKEFSLPQHYGVMEIHKRNNILISAPTGATKTLTAFLSIINELVNLAEAGNLENHTYCVYVSPLKALNNDIQFNLEQPLKEITDIARKHGKDIDIRVGVRTGDTTPYEKSKMVKNAPHILITTPESLAIILSSKKIREHLTQLWWVVIDEIHSLAENKRGVHLSLSLERLQRLSNFTRIGLSATVAPLEGVAQYLVGANRDCRIVDIRFLKKNDIKVISPVKNIIRADWNQMQDATYNLLDKLIQEHRCTLIFTNTRAATERVVHNLKIKFPSRYIENADPLDEEVKGIGAHHGSLSKRHRLRIEQKLRDGKLKAVVTSTSLELGIDIGYVDLVILLGSPKSVARAAQRIGRSGHKLYETAKGRIIVLDRDDLVECSLILKNVLDEKIDKIHIPENCLDVLAQQIFGMAIADVYDVDDLYSIIKQSYCYRNLERTDFNNIISYLAGEFASLEDRNVYAKIWHNENKIGKKGKLARMIYMTNIGTIPDQTSIKVKIGEAMLGTIDEGFLERLRKGDVFVLGGETYKFNFARGTVAQVESASGKQPTVPNWVSEMLPLSFDLAMEIQKFRKDLNDMFKKKSSKKEILEFIYDYLYVDENAANSIYEYFKEQFYYAAIPHVNKLIVEHYSDEFQNKHIIFHSLYGRRVNDVLSRALAYAISIQQHRDVEISITDNGFTLKCSQKVIPMKAFNLLKSKDIRKVMELAIDKTQVLKTRFRHCATRALMILRSYKGNKKSVGKQQVSSMILISAVKRISNDFPILKEARREVLDDLMDVVHAAEILEQIEQGRLQVEEIFTTV
ncbi:ATP-dependent helicase, partial [Candidatus Woesearchaeota archaeon]|nr:ATP-dependent helicase [Candidatus Woesearchaeota archaeon]